MSRARSPLQALLLLAEHQFAQTAVRHAECLRQHAAADDLLTAAEAAHGAVRQERHRLANAPVFDVARHGVMREWSRATRSALSAAQAQEATAATELNASRDELGQHRQRAFGLAAALERQHAEHGQCLARREAIVLDELWLQHQRNAEGA